MILKPYSKAVVQILINDKLVGTGVLVANKYILTCAHVLSKGDISVSFNLHKDNIKENAEIIYLGSKNDGTDVALLEIEQSLPEINYPLSEIELENLTLEIYGYDQEPGRWVTAIYRGINDYGWGQISFDGDKKLGTGFSGAPAWNVVNNVAKIVGIAVATDTDDSNNSYIIPISEILKIEEIKTILKKYSINKNPYRGLASFRKKDINYYFGRENDIKNVLNKVIKNEESNLFTLVGISGVGKSSFLQAGLIPAFENLEYTIIYLTPKENPLDKLASKLHRYLTNSDIEAAIGAQKFKNSFKSSEKDDSEIILNSVKIITEKYPKLLIIIDQFEEIFTISKDEEKKLFLEKMHHLLVAKELNVKVIFSLRVDFLEKLLDYPKYFELFNERSRFFMGYLSVDNLKKIIVEPAKIQGVTYEKGVAERIIEDIKEEKGALPLLEQYLTVLWNKQVMGRITHEAVNEMGGVANSIGNYAEDIYNKFKTEDEKKAVKRVMLQVIFPGEGKEDTRQIALLGKFNESDRKIINELATNRLLVTDKTHSNKETIEIIHEALISKWKTLRDWIDEYRPFMKWQQKLRAQISDWKNKDKDESYLLRGRQLEEALEQKEDYKEFMFDEEIKFIEESNKLQETIENKQRKRTFYIRLGLTLFIISLLGFLFYTNRQKDQILEQNNKIIKLYASFLAETYRPNSETYTPTLISEIVKSFNEPIDKKIKIINILTQYGFIDPSKKPLRSTSNLDFHVFIQKIFQGDVGYIKEYLSDLKSNMIWAWNQDELEAFSIVLSSKYIINPKSYEKKIKENRYVVELAKFASNPNKRYLNKLFEYKYFTINDTNSSNTSGIDAILSYDEAISINLYYIETNQTKDIGFKKYTKEQLKSILKDRLNRVQKIGKVLYEHSQQYPEKYSKSNVQNIYNMYSQGIFEIKTDNKMKKDYPYYKELLPSDMKAKYLQAEKKKDLVLQQRWLEEILKIVPDNPWTLNKVATIAFIKKEKNIEPYFSANLNANKEWKNALKFVLNPQDLNTTSTIITDEKQKKLISSLYEQYASYYYKQKNRDYTKIILENNLRLKFETSSEEKVSIYGNLSWYYLFTKEYQKSLDVGNKALEINPKQIWIYTNIAHANLLLGNIEKAKMIYLKYVGKKIHLNQRVWENTILDDFKTLKEYNITSPYFDEIKKLMQDKVKKDKKARSKKL